jgi:hypothetical protein
MDGGNKHNWRFFLSLLQFPPAASSKGPFLSCALCITLMWQNSYVQHANTGTNHCAKFWARSIYWYPYNLPSLGLIHDLAASSGRFRITIVEAFRILPFLSWSSRYMCSAGTSYCRTLPRNCHFDFGSNIKNSFDVTRKPVTFLLDRGVVYHIVIFTGYLRRGQ